MSSERSIGYGPALRPKIPQFNSSAQSFPKYQNDLQNSFVTAYPSPMHPDSIKRFAGHLSPSMMFKPRFHAQRAVLARKARRPMKNLNCCMKSLRNSRQSNQDGKKMICLFTVLCRTPQGVLHCIERSEDILSPMTNKIGLYLYLDNKTMKNTKANTI